MQHCNMRCCIRPPSAGLSGKNKMANSIDTDDTSHYEPYHQDLHCLHGICFGLQG